MPLKRGPQNVPIYVGSLHFLTDRSCVDVGLEKSGGADDSLRLNKLKIHLNFEALQLRKVD